MAVVAGEASEQYAWRCRLAATVRAPVTVRHAFAKWLHSVGWPPEQAEDMVLAVNEAVTNSVDHSHPVDGPSPLIELDAHVIDNPDAQTRQVVVTVADNGRWRPPSANPGYRGRGLLIMRALTASLHIDTTPDGTRLRLWSTPVIIDSAAVSSPHATTTR